MKLLYDVISYVRVIKGRNDNGWLNIFSEREFRQNTIYEGQDKVG